jgi:Tfp pilus assembly protein FimT
MSNYTKGISVLEILITIAILAVVTAVTFTAFVNTYKYHALDKAEATVMSMLNQARTYTLASQNAASYGVHIATSTVTLFYGAAYAANEPSNEVVQLDRRVYVATTTLNGGGSNIVFSRLTGMTTNYGTITLGLVSTSTDSTSTTTTIRIHQTGIIESI